MAVEIASSPSAPRNDDPSGSKIVETAFARLRPFGASGALGRGLTYNKLVHETYTSHEMA